MTKEEIKEAVKEALDERLKEFYIDREIHYQDHLFIKAFRGWTKEAKKTIWKTIVKGVVTILGGLLILGFILWEKKYL